MSKNYCFTAEAMKEKDILFYVSEGFVEIRQPNVTFDSANKKPDFKQIATTFFGRRETKQVAIWIFVLSVLLGIGLTTILTVLLMKVGFFNRKIKDDLDALKSAEEVTYL